MASSNQIHEPVQTTSKNQDHLSPAVGHYEDLLAFQWRTIQEQQRTIEMLTVVIERIAKTDDHVVDAEVSL